MNEEEKELEIKRLEKLEFNLDRASAYLKVSKEFIAEVKINQNAMDLIYNQLGISIDAMFYSALKEERILTYYCPRPTFLDWLFRREKKVKWRLIVKDLLIDPPKLGAKRIYIENIL
jgi:hypothetical protein